MVCKYSCHILKDRLATVVKEYNLVMEEQLVASGQRGRSCRDQIVSLTVLRQTKVALKEDGFLAAFIDSSIRLMTEHAGRHCGS